MPTNPLPVGVLLLGAALPAAAAPPEPVRFNRDVRPILADHCYQCHGPDKARRKADLRLDVEPRTGVLTPGKPAESELIRRVGSDDESERMPPPGKGRPLSAAQIDLLRRWVAGGAKWEGQWAFSPPARPEPPAVRNAAWVRNPIDRFVLARLEREGLAPSPEAQKAALARRLSLDLTGLPPTPEEVDAFAADPSPDAVGKLADRLLASPRFGERMAWRWLEAARYADTNGYQTDGERDMWRWRDWVIQAYNRDLPYDRFVTEQLAGDLLPNPTLDQRIATGFNRNHRGNAEGGIVPEEYAVEYVVDRVETTATVFLGLTVGCARCHDHKFDPVTQKEFYRLFAFFNNVPEKGRAVKFGNSPPLIKAPTPDQQRRLAELTAAVARAEERVAKLRDTAAAAQVRWEAAVDRESLPVWAPDRGQVAHWPNMSDLDGRRLHDVGDVADFGFDDRFSVALRVRPRKPSGALLTRTQDEPRGEGYGVYLADGKVQVHLTKRWLDDALRVETRARLAPGEWHHVAVTYDGSRLAAGVKVYLDGAETPARTLLDELNQDFRTREPLRLGAGGGPDSRLDGLLDDVRVYRRVLDPDEARILAVPASPAEILGTPAGSRSAGESAKVRAFFTERAAPQEIRDAHESLRRVRESLRTFADAIPTVMVMEEMPTPRTTRVLTRGEYDKPGEAVTPGVPAALNSLPRGAAADRLGLAAWVTDPANPLAARVAVNRAWQLHFGAGLVRTAEDFGTQGEYPSHPDLLDWLATEFVRTGWDVKRLHHLIVTSATYRQSSRVPKDLLARDPENRLLARGPRYRLSAEAVRDQALAAAGLLVEKLGGPSVKPYQPAGLWKELSGAADYQPDTGDALYRRSLYTYWKRTVPPPGLAAFDAPAREACWVREARTNTPLQALALLNDVTYVEAARALAGRVVRDGGTPDERLTRAFRRVLARAPTSAELRLLRGNLGHHLTEYRADPAAAAKLIRVGESKPAAGLDPTELAAYTAVCRLILNLDEAVTKE